MNEAWRESSDGKPEIVRISATPQEDKRVGYSPREVSLWNQFSKWIGSWFKTGDDLAGVYADSKVTQEAGKAKKVLEEAMEISAKTDETRVKTELAQQEVVGKFTENLKEIDNLPEHMQPFAFAKMVEQNPNILSQVEKVKVMLDSLQLNRGTTLTPLTPEKIGAESLSDESIIGEISSEE